MSAGEQALTNAGRIKACFILLANLGRNLLALLEIAMNLSAVIQIVTNHCIHISECERRVLLSNSFRSCPLAKRLNYSIERDASVCDMHNTISIGGKRNRLISYNYSRPR